jgi:hypothetical protein
VINPGDQVWAQLRARLETVGSDLVLIAQSQGVLADPSTAYLTISLAVGTLETILYEMRRAGLVVRRQP